MAVLGSVAFDRLERDDRISHRLGGATTYSGLTAAKLGWKVWLSACVPENRRHSLMVLEQYAHTRWFPSVHPTLFVNREQAGAERVQQLQSVSEPFRTKYWKTLVESLEPGDHPRQPVMDWVHLGPLFDGDFQEGLSAAVREHAAFISADLQGWLRAGECGSVKAALSPAIWNDLYFIDILKASEAEWKHWQTHSTFSPEQMFDKFPLRAILVSRGEQGGVLYRPGEQLPWQAVPAGSSVLETGAGDVFCAAFVDQYLHRSAFCSRSLSLRELAAALRGAASVASLHVSGKWLEGIALDWHPDAEMPCE